MKWSFLLAVGLIVTAAASARADVDTAWIAYLKGDYRGALAEMQPLAEAGDADAQYAMGSLHCDGLAIRRNYREAAAWFERAARQGHARARFSLGFLYYYGAGQGADDGIVYSNREAAARWLAPAAEDGYPLAQQLLGVMYLEGDGVPQDEDKALRWSLAAAEQDVAEAQYQAGYLLGSKRRAWASWVESYKWFLLAARTGTPGAAQNLEILAERMNRKEIAEAESLAAAWKPAAAR